MSQCLSVRSSKIDDSDTVLSDTVLSDTVLSDTALHKAT